jgi:hypothetical protein
MKNPGAVSDIKDIGRGEGLIPCGSAALMKVLNPSPIHYENNIPRGSVPRYVDFRGLTWAIGFNYFSW